MKRLSANRKAVSPVIATVLMIMVVMTGMTILFAFVGTYAQSFQKGSGSSVLESLTVENEWYSTPQAGPSQLVIWVYNMGKTSFTINSVYLNSSMVTNYNILDSNNAPINPGTAITVGEHFQIKVPITVPDASYTLKLVTGRGSGFEGVYSP